MAAAISDSARIVVPAHSIDTLLERLSLHALLDRARTGERAASAALSPAQFRRQAATSLIQSPVGRLSATASGRSQSYAPELHPPLRHSRDERWILDPHSPQVR